MWKSTEFIVVPHRDSKDVFILGGTDDIQVLLDDSQVSREIRGERREEEGGSGEAKRRREQREVDETERKGREKRKEEGE